MNMKKEKYMEFIWSLAGCFLFAFGVNVIITPLGLYNGGFMGVAQLIRTALFNLFDFSFLQQIDIAGIIYYLINIPIFYWAFREMGKGFLVRSVISVTIQSTFMTIIPVPTTPVFGDVLMSCLIGGLVVGTGVGCILRGRSSGGGQDIIGVICAKKYPGFSVGKVAILMNIAVYAVCLFMFDIEVVVYSLIYTTVLAMMSDRVHVQNINMSVMIFTKKDGIAKLILEEMGRGVTSWEGVGEYTQENTHVFYVMISKYELEQLKEIVHRVDPNAFIVMNEGTAVVGNFEKRL